MSTESTTTPAPAPGVQNPAAQSLRLDVRRGRWIEHWNAEDSAQWEAEGRAVARRNLRWSIFAEFLGFVVWQLWSIVVVSLPVAGFRFDTSQTFWLISMPSLVGATLRIPYTFTVSRFGGRNWTVVSALLLLIPTLGLAACVANPSTPFWLMLAVAGLAGFGGGNFASSMANITFFFPAREKGWALGLNAAGGNLGAAVAQLAVPLAVSLAAFVASGAAAAGKAGSTLAVAGLMWVPLILVAAFGALRRMDNLAHAKGDLAGSLAALREPHLWVVSLLYIGTFGSFIGFGGVFPKLIHDIFPAYSVFTVSAAGVPAALSLAFLGPLVGSLARPYGGRLADRFGGARITVASFAVMAAATIALVATLPLKGFWLFLGLFLVLFAASGVGNGSTYRMIPVIFARASRAARGGAPASHTARLASAALGLISAVGAYGGFVIPQLLGASSAATGSYVPAFLGFVAAYALMLAVCWGCYLRRGSLVAQAGA
ncbi:MFS transporter [Sinomonas atrocyanea]|uniref:MFS transporter n=1 Tax=Sinomonas atrocyanea TaxID=37927 RepID=UPI002865BDEB|nr:MFS transporter [Sinomonas atrocyanea]MDR6621792.1 NNP family nitrate/nitrite transporter-like MFS transporter [Sinomonas atrocyanea]